MKQTYFVLSLIGLLTSASAFSAGTISITVDKNPACRGDTVHFRASTTGASAGVQFQWQQNGNDVGIPSGDSTYSSTFIANGDTITCILDPSGAKVTSAKIVMNITTPPSPPSISRSGNVLTSSYNTGNQWYNGNTPIQNATFKTYTVTVSSNYVVKVNFGGCIVSSLPISVTLSSISQIAKDAGINLYPTPNMGSFTVVCPHTEGAELIITDLTGRTVHSESLLLPTQRIDVSTLAPQMYIATVRMNGVNYPVTFQIQ